MTKPSLLKLVFVMETTYLAATIGWPIMLFNIEIKQFLIYHKHLEVWW